MNFTKWHGLGNDFVITEWLKGEALPSADTAIKICDRYRGIGGDGWVLLLPGNEEADLTMHIFNSDGTVAEMCGNAIRCVAIYAYRNGLASEKKVKINTLAGLKIAEIVDEEEGIVRVNMGRPQLLNKDIGVYENPDEVALRQHVMIADRDWEYTGVSMGNPHAVFFVENAEDIALTEWGPQIETHPSFRHKINVEFASVTAPNQLRMRVWERGCGVTQACGTGSCATLVAAVTNGLIDKEADILLDGGTLHIEWEGGSAPVFMSGPATFVFSGETELK